MSVTVFRLAADPGSEAEKPLIPDRQGTERLSQKEENYMAVTDSLTLERLRREQNLAEQQGMQALNISKILKNHPQYDAARQKADALLAKASALREQIVKIETD